MRISYWIHLDLLDDVVHAELSQKYSLSGFKDLTEIFVVLEVLLVEVEHKYNLFAIDDNLSKKYA